MKNYFLIERYFIVPDTKEESLMGSYVQEMTSINDALDGEFDGWEEPDDTILKISIIRMNESDFLNLEEFQGY